MGIKTYWCRIIGRYQSTLKNLPTTWGLRPTLEYTGVVADVSLKNLPTTWGLRLTILYLIHLVS